MLSRLFVFPLAKGKHSSQGSKGQRDCAFLKCHLSLKLDYNKQIKRKKTVWQQFEEISISVHQSRMRQYITQMTLLSYGHFHNQISICIKEKKNQFHLQDKRWNTPRTPTPSGLNVAGKTPLWNCSIVQISKPSFMQSPIRWFTEHLLCRHWNK